MRGILITTLITVTLVVGGVQWLTSRDSTDLGFCRAEVGNTVVEVDLEQAKWVSLMAASGQRRGLPPRATTIAIATAYQESKIHNIDYGDRDSVGLFQQRPSQGWGSIDQILDPNYSIGAFYDGLVKVKDYETMPVTDAAQAVQRSGFPTAYARHESNARALASSLRGHSPAAFSCAVEAQPGSLGALQDHLNTAWGNVTITKAADDQVIRLSGPAKDTTPRGWALAQFLVANAAEFGVAEVIFDEKRWRVTDGAPRWVSVKNTSRSEVRFRLS